jgi:hypothetical protein
MRGIRAHDFLPGSPTPAVSHRVGVYQIGDV